MKNVMNKNKLTSKWNQQIKLWMELKLIKLMQINVNILNEQNFRI